MNNNLIDDTNRVLKFNAQFPHCELKACMCPVHIIILHNYNYVIGIGTSSCFFKTCRLGCANSRFHFTEKGIKVVLKSVLGAYW